MRQMRGVSAFGRRAASSMTWSSIFDELNVRFFHGLAGASANDLEPGPLASQPGALRSRRTTPSSSAESSIIAWYRDMALEYIVYHEMLHLKHPVKLRGSRRCVHGPEFQAEEKLFPELDKAKEFLKRL